MLVVEVENVSGQDANQIGETYGGRYRYAVKVNRQVIAEGEVEHNRRTHWSLLLRRIVDEGRKREFEAVMGQSPEEYMASHKESL